MAGLIVLVAYLTYLFIDVTFDRRIQPRIDRNNQYLETHLVSWRQDVASVRELDELLTFNSRNADAGEFLNNHLGWHNIELTDTAFALDIPEATKAALAGESWLQAEVTPETGQAAAQFIGQLQDYDHWSIYRDEPWQREQADPDQVMLFTYPLVEDLVTASRLYIVSAKQPELALNQVIHLAKLMMSTQWFGVSWHAIAMLEDVAEARQHMLDQGLVEVGEVVVPTRAQLRSMRRTLVLYPYLLHPLVNPEILLAALDTKPTSLTCAGQFGAVNQQLMYRHWLDDRLPFERDDPATFNLLGEQLLKNCSLDYHRTLWLDRNWLPPMRQARQAAEPYRRRRSRVWNWILMQGEEYPYLRKLVASTIASSVMIYNTNKDYESLGDRGTQVVF